MLKTKICSLILLFCIPALNYAAIDLAFANNTKIFSTMKFNYATCSNFLGYNGIFRPYTFNILPSKLLSQACAQNTRNCRADIYTTINCIGPVIGTIFIDTNLGITSKRIYNNSFFISIQRTKIILSGGFT